MKRGAEPDRIDRRHGPAHQLTSHARLGERCYRLYYIIPTSPSSSLSSVRRRPTNDDRNKERERRASFRSANDERAENMGNKERERL